MKNKQNIANRKNAQKSTGPKTAEGKKISTQNSIKHGLHSRNTVINSPTLKESQFEYDTLLQSLFDELKPTTSFQESLVIKIANCLWRSRRATIAETAIINRQMEWLEDNGLYKDLTYQLQEIPDLPPEPGIHDDTQEVRTKIAQSRSNLIGTNILPQNELNNNILRYEMRLDRQLTRTYRLLKSLQSPDDIKKMPIDKKD